MKHPAKTLRFSALHALSPFNPQEFTNVQTDGATNNRRNSHTDKQLWRISDDEKTLKILVFCNSVFRHKENASILYQQDIQRFDAVYRFWQQDIKQRYTKEDADKLWMSAITFDMASKRSPYEQVADCRKWTDAQIELWNGMRALER